MIPSSLATVIAFLVLVAPGVLYESLYERRRPAYRTSTFREISRVVLASVILSGAAIAVLAVVRAVLPDLMPDPRRLIADPQTYAQDHYRLITVAVVAQFVIALALAWAWNLYRGRGEPKSIEPVSSWFEIFRQEAPAGQVPYLQVRLSTGTTYEGTLAHYSPDPELVDRELVLGPPLAIKIGERPRTPVSLPERLIIPGPAIVTIFVSYIDRRILDDWIAASPREGITFIKPA